MQEMGWTFQQLLDTPPYVRTFCEDFLGMQRGTQNEDPPID